MVRRRKLWYGGGNSTTAEEVSRLQRLFPNPSWLVWGRAAHHQKLTPTFPWIGRHLIVTKRDFLEMEASLWLNEKSRVSLKVGCLRYAVGRQPIFSDILVIVTFLFWENRFCHHIKGSCLSLGALEQVFLWLDAFPHIDQLGLGKRRWNLGTSSVVVEFPLLFMFTRFCSPVSGGILHSSQLNWGTLTASIGCRRGTSRPTHLDCDNWPPGVHGFLSCRVEQSPGRSSWSQHQSSQF